MGKGVPDRWLDYTCYGNVINDTRLLALKVPLKKELCQLLKEDQIFTPDHAIEKIQNLGLIIDLTYTDRYYNPVDFTRYGIDHEKIMCEGKVIPREDVVRRFFEIVDTYLHTNHDKVVGVHCTHGVNRTGYLICRYLIQRLGYNPRDALIGFNNARGHDMEREEYIDDLFTAKWRFIEPMINFNFTKRMKGSDASGKNEMELPLSLQKFSDDEKEREAKRKKKSQNHNNRIEIAYEGERPPQKRGRGRGQSTESYRPRVSNNPFGSNYQQTSLPQREYVPRFQPPQNTTFNSQLTFRPQEGHSVNFQSVEIVGSNYQPQIRQQGLYEPNSQSLQNSGLHYQSPVRTRGGYVPRYQSSQNFNRSTEMSVLHPPRFDHFRQQGLYEPNSQSLQNSGLHYQSPVRTRGGYVPRYQSPQNFNRSTEMSVLHPPRFDHFYENQQQSDMNVASSSIHHTSSPRFQPRPPPRYSRFGGTPGWSYQPPRY